MTQGKQGPIEDVRGGPVIDMGSVTEQVDLKARELARSFVAS
jgi:hypothetical protein